MFKNFFIFYLIMNENRHNVKNEYRIWLVIFLFFIPSTYQIKKNKKMIGFPKVIAGQVCIFTFSFDRMWCQKVRRIKQILCCPQNIKYDKKFFCTSETFSLEISLSLKTLLIKKMDLISNIKTIFVAQITVHKRQN